MNYSQMTQAERKTLLDDPDNYPLWVSFLGKRALLTCGEVTFLRENGIDFAVRDEQVRDILGEEAVAMAAVQRTQRRIVEGIEEAAERVIPPRRQRSLFLPLLEAVAAGLAAVLMFLALILRVSLAFRHQLNIVWAAVRRLPGLLLEILRSERRR